MSTTIKTMTTLDEDFAESSGADYIDGSEIVRAFFEIPPDGLIDIDEDLQVVAIDNYVRSSHRAEAEGILSYLQDKVESGALNHVKGLRGEDHKGYKSKLYLVLEVDGWIKRYYAELTETDGRTVPRNGVLSIDGHRAFALPTYLNASGWTRDESRLTLQRILEAGIEPCEGEFFSGVTQDADGILRPSRRHKVFVFLEEDIYEFLPIRLDEIGRGLLQVPDYDVPDGLCNITDGVRYKFLKVVGLERWAEANGTEQRRIKRLMRKLSIFEIKGRRVMARFGQLPGVVCLEDDVDWLLPQSPNPDGTIELKLPHGSTMPAIAPLLVFTIKAQRLRLARELKAAGYKPITDVQVTNPDTTKKASKLDVYEFNEAVAGIIERVKRESHKKHR